MLVYESKGAVCEQYKEELSFHCCLRCFADEYLLLLGSALGCSNSAAEAELAGQPEVLADLRRRNAHDLEVYRYALALHERQAREEGVADVARRRA